MSSEPNAITRHVVILPGPLHGHWPTSAVFVVKLVKECPGTFFTFLVVGGYFEEMNRTLDLYFTSEEVHLRNNIRVIQMGGEGLALDTLLPVIFQNFSAHFASLVSSSPISCTSGKTYPGIRSPDLAIIDPFFLAIIHIIRSITPTKIPIYGWVSVNSVAMVRFKNKEVGGYGDVAVEAPIIAKQSNKSVEEASYELYHPTKGEIIHIPGLPTMYDYETDIERAPLSVMIPVIQLKNTIHLFLRECDGVLTASDDVLEPEANVAFRAWFAETNRSVYVLGPLTPKQHNVSAPEVSDFLSKMQGIYGEYSVIYVSFGTNFSPMGPGFARIMEVILDMGIPMIYSSAANANLPSEIIERLNESDRVFTSPWIPQRTVLTHPATCCFLTHCGQNSTTEAISAGVPMIAYPLTADQPMNAVYISQVHNIGYELMEIRTQDALRPAYRGIHPIGTLVAIEKEIRNVISKAFGPDGEEKRRNIREMRGKRNALWDEEGSSRREFERFIKENLKD